MKRIQKLTKVFILIVLLVLSMPSALVTAQSGSTNYSVEEYTFGAGGTNDAASASYQGRASIGDLGVGNSASSNFQMYAGYTTTDEPYLEFVVPATTVDFGVLSTGSTATGAGAFYVRTYLANGYTVQTVSDPPANGSYTLANMPIQAAPSPGTEGFGINLVANTVPASFGANASQAPDATFSFGYAATGYDTANVYKYVKNDVIARSDSSSGRTDYTISYVIDIEPNTPGGVYTLDHYMVVTSTF